MWTATANGCKDMHCAGMTMIRPSDTERESEPAGAVILAGGRSSRMGTNKALLPFEGKPLIDHMTKLLARSGFAPVLISGTLEGYCTISDKVGQKGPVAGIHAVVQNVQTMAAPRSWLFVPVDMPLLTEKLLKRLSMCKCKYSSDGAIFNDMPLPIFLRLHDNVLKAVDEAAARLSNGESSSVISLISNLNLCRTKHTEAEKRCFLNTNTPKEWQGAMG